MQISAEIVLQYIQDRSRFSTEYIGENQNEIKDI